MTIAPRRRDTIRRETSGSVDDPSRFVASTSAKSFGWLAPSSMSRVIPALHTSASIRPCSAAMALNTLLIAALSVTSSWYPLAVSPSCLATCATRSPSRPVTTTVAPASTRAVAVASPIPRVAPVTTATRPLNLLAVSVTDTHPGQHIHGNLEAAHVDDLLGFQLHAEFVLD